MNKPERRKAVKPEEYGYDLISNLPDHILLLILSGLPSTEEIIRTSVLSRRWRYLWTSIHSLDLVCPRGWKPSEKSKKSKFKEFVYWVLLNRSVDLDSFRLSCLFQYSMSTVERWIHAAVMRNVKQLDLSFSSMEKSEDMVMPHCLVTCASLEVLRLCFVKHGRLLLPSFSGFPALRVLKLKYVDLFDGDLVKDFLESCPMLEDLTFDNCMLDKLDGICISCTKLKKLRIFGSDLRGFLKISCPKLVFLELTSVEASNYIFERLYSLKEAIIDPELDAMYRLFPGISHVESLTTNFHFLYHCMDDAACDPALSNLKTLELTTISASFTAKYLIQILKHCPKLEYLSLTIDNVVTYDPMDPDGPEYEMLDESETRRMLTPDVKWIEVFEINGEKPKLDIHWYPNEGGWMYVDATWGNKS